jgi:nucleoside-diphosphate-sugar epimerase
MPTTLITGAGGLVGRILWKGLGDRRELRGIDRRRGPAIRRRDMTKLRSVEGDFAGVDSVVDLAGLPEVTTPWGEVLKNNIPATMNALEASRRGGVRRFVFASSNHVTGMYEHEEPYSQIVAGDVSGMHPDEIPLIRTTDPIRPDSPYGIGKALGEAAGRYYAEQSDLSVVCLRIGTVNPAHPRRSRPARRLRSRRAFRSQVRDLLRRLGKYVALLGRRQRGGDRLGPAR